MPYKTILVHVDELQRAQERIKIAAHLALKEEAHLIGTAMTGISRFIYANAVIPEADPNLIAHLDILRERAHSAVETFASVAQNMGVTSIEKRVFDDEASEGICLQARYSDLVVIGQTDPRQRLASVPLDFVEYTVLHAARPALIVPYAGQFNSVGKRVLIAWNARAEATRAVTNAIPLLQRADVVHVAVFNPGADIKSHGELPGADIALYLARHGIKVEISQPTVRGSIGDAVLTLAANLSADLLVMGGYGHSRLREMIMGGVTKTILRSMTLPVLMSH